MSSDSNDEERQSTLPALVAIRRDIEPLEQFAKQSSLLATTLVINNTESLGIANNAIVDLTTKIKQVKERKDFFTKPIKQHVKLIDGVFDAIIKPLELANTTLRDKVVHHRLEQQEAQRQIQEILSIPDPSIAGSDRPPSPPTVITPTIEQQKSMKTDSGATIGTTPKWDFAIDNITAIPEEVLRTTMNTRMGREALESVIRAMVKAGVRTIPGVNIYPSEQLSVRP